MRMLNKISVVVMFLAFAAFAGATTVNSNSRIADGIEYYIQTDKFTYQLGEEVQMLYKITNLSEQSITITATRIPAYHFSIERDNGVEVWATPNPSIFGGGLFTLSPGEFKLFPNEPDVWNMQNKAGEIVTIGNYNVFGGIYGSYGQTNVSVPIEIVPEPATFLLLTFGVMWPRLIRRDSHNNRFVR